MIFPSRSEFKQLEATGNIIPVFKEYPMGEHSPVSVYEKLGGPKDNTFILESGKGAEKISRYSFVGGNPFLTFKSYGTKVELESKGRIESYEGNPLDILKDLFSKFDCVKSSQLPKFFGGGIGYFSYDVVRHIERLPDTAEDELNIPEIYLMFVDWVCIFDHLEGTIKLVVNAMDGNNYDEVSKRLNELEDKIFNNSGHAPWSWECDGKARDKGKLQANFTEEEFAQIVRKGKEYIAAGDIFQVNLSVRLSKELQVPAYQVYKKLREINPSPYSGFIKFKEFEIVSCSPELLVKNKGELAETRPIAGTRRRGKNREEDMELIKELLGDKKENAEHIMLVDLERNDLGRVCKYGTVEVDELMVTEEYSHVIHIVSNVKGELAPEMNRFDVIKATFPGGTITGAPKVRCMEIIEELEGVRRGIYTGSMGWLNFGEDMELNIAIRTILVKDKKAYIQAGAGVVADSDPYREYHESLKKAEAMVRAIEQAEEV
ncbi:anthranilate synthase component 1/para-aminobenzoate synthetase component 1 [Desulfitispora alkaliphila]|uniref:anthranilate synthase component I n=1 Tax=Desulfitispora alkaliphila TaxID=622674 RepID=UPI003D1AE3AB